jgi:hypothetical protein
VTDTDRKIPAPLINKPEMLESDVQRELEVDEADILSAGLC